MKKIFYYDNALPPKRWLVMASLLWDKIWISPIIGEFLLKSPFTNEFKDLFLVGLYRSNAGIIDTARHVQDSEKFIQMISNEEEKQYFKKNIGDYVDIVLKNPFPFEKWVELQNKARVYAGMRNVALLQKTKKEMEQVVESWEKKLASEATKYNHAFYNYKFREAIPELEFFFDNEKSFQSYCPNRNKVFVYSVEAFIPYLPEKVTVRQIEDFRAGTSSQRIKFRKVSQELLSDIMRSSTQSDFNNSMTIFKDYLNDELDALRKSYRNCKINAGFKIINIVGVGSFVTLLSRIFAMPIYEPASIVAAASCSTAVLLSDLEKGRAEINKSPWGYLMSLVKLKKV